MRAAYREIQLYNPGRLPCPIDLSDNTNLFGMPPSAARLLETLPAETITRYPSVFADSLKVALARWHDVEPENITTGCGSDDIIDSALRAVCEPGEILAYADPTFGIVPTFARMNAIRPVAVSSVADLTTTDASVRYLCTPNNPTGSATPRAIIAALPGVVLLDEAYAAFGDADHATFAATSDSLVSVRTMSKAWGLAGLRVGYAIGPAPLIREIEKSRGPYKVSALAEAAAVAAITNDGAWVADVVDKTRRNRTRLMEALAALDLECVPSEANFLLVRLPAGCNAIEMNDILRQRGVAARPFPQLRGFGECIRVTIGPWPLLETFLQAFADALEVQVS